MILGEEIRYLRIKKHMTQEELAQKIGVKRQYLGRIESLKQLPSLRTLLKITKVLGTSFQRIKDLLSDAEFDLNIRKLGFTESETVELVKSLLSMPKDHKQVILQTYARLKRNK